MYVDICLLYSGRQDWDDVTQEHPCECSTSLSARRRASRALSDSTYGADREEGREPGSGNNKESMNLIARKHVEKAVQRQNVR